MSKRSTIYDDDGNPINVREVSDDGRTSTLYEYNDSIWSHASGDHRGKPIEVADHHEDGRTDAYEYNDSIWSHASGNHRGEKKNDDDKGCFLTTACTRYAGLPDDCHELEVLREFRDSFVRELRGEQVIEEYYRIAPAIVQLIECSSERDQTFAELLSMIRAAVQDIENGNEAQAFDRYSATMMTLKERFC